MIVGIDPGMCTGICVLGGQPLGLPNKIQAGIFHEDTAEVWWSLIAQCEMAYIEKPKIYPQGHKRPNDLITLALKAGELAGQCLARGVLVRYVEPAEWKRQLPKEICHNRIKARLGPGERAQLAGLEGLAKSYQHNAWDAVGIALFGVGRRVFT